jgi:putative endonuclease
MKRKEDKIKAYNFGFEQEQRAIQFLMNRDYQIIKNRYKTKFGEVDIIAKKDNLLVFIEVKARKKEELIEVILRASQIQRIKNAALFFIAQNPQFQNFDISFDFILVNDEIIHHKNYF